jgi:hypothetical protein
MSESVFCIAKSTAHAQDILQRLRIAGFSLDSVSMLYADRASSQDMGHENNTKAPEGAAAGTGAGALVGGTFGWLVGIGALAIPGVGAMIAAGPIMAALSGAAVGGAFGGLTGALMGLGAPEFEAKRYEGKLLAGNVLISVHTDTSEEASRAQEIFESAGAEDISTATEASVPHA